MKKLLFSFFLLAYNLGYSTPQLDSLYPVRITFYKALMSEKYLPSHIEAEIMDVNKLPQFIKTQYNFKQSPKDGGNYPYINYMKLGNRKPETNPSQKYKGVTTHIIYLNIDQLINFIETADKIGKQISELILGDPKKGYNILRNNCADALSKALGLNPENYKLFSITFPAYVYKGIIKNFSE